MKKILIFFIVTIMMCSGFSASAEGNMQSGHISAQPSSQGITLYAAVVERKVRFYNKKYQYRRWNVTYGYWVDPYWINL